MEIDENPKDIDAINDEITEVIKDRFGVYFLFDFFL